MKLASPHREFNQLFLATLGLYLALGVLLVLGWVANSHRIHEIQSSRTVSCERTYEGIREVFRPFFRPPDKSTPKEKADQLKFNITIDRLKKNCSKQTKTQN